MFKEARRSAFVPKLSKTDDVTNIDIIELKCTISFCSSPALDKNGQMKITYKNNYLISAGTQGFNLSRKLAKFSKEKKAAKTLGTVMGIFIICWLPFFVTNIISGFCTHCLGSNIEVVFQIVTWLGWMNSGMNPCIYACCSKDFNR